MSRRVTVLAGAAAAALFMLAVTASSADTFTVRLVSQTSSTITLGWDPQPGYGYLFSADGQLVSRTNDASRSSVKFSKGASSYEVAVVTKGATGTYPPPAAPPPPPPPPPAAVITQTLVDGSTVANVNDWRAVYDANADGIEDDPGSIEFLVDGARVLSEINAPFGDTFANGSIVVADGQHTFLVRALNDSGTVLATSSVSATVAAAAPPPPPPPGSCAYPAFPDASCTGVPAGTTLTAGSGTLTVSTDGAVVNGRDWAGTIYVNANNVTVQNSRATTIVVNTSKTGTVIKDTEVNCPNTSRAIMGGNSSGGGDPAVNLTVTRVDIEGCEDGLVLGSNVTVTDSWLHNPGTCCNDPHNDGIQFLSAASSVRIEHNAIYWRDTSDLQMCNNTGCGTFSNVLIRHNLFSLAPGGAYNIYCPQNPSVNFVIDTNAFAEDGRGSFGLHTDCGGETLVGNYLYPSGTPVS